MRRARIYYPKSKIITNLYTLGKEWMLEDGTEYIGYYHKYLDGKVLTEAVYSKTKSKKLITYIDSTTQPLNLIYNKLKNITSVSAPSPVNVYSVPTLDDYSNGFFTRYFIYRRNFVSIFQDFFEVNEPQYKSWKKPKSGINEILYNAFSIEWKLTGPERDIIINGQIKEFGVYDTNRRLAFFYDNTYPHTSKILTDYTEFSIYSSLTSEEIRKQFGVS